MDVIRAIRNMRAERNVPPAKRTAITLVAKAENQAACLASIPYVERLAGGSSVKVQQDKAGVPENAVTLVCHLAEVCIPLAELVDVEKERERVAKEITRVESEIARAQGKLSNQGFVAKAPEKVVAEERQKLVKAQEMLQKLKEQAKELK